MDRHDFIVYVDMDETQVALVEGIDRLLNHTTRPLESWYPEGVYDLNQAFGFRSTHIWDRVADAGPDFWANLEPLEHSEQLLWELLSLIYEENLFYCSTPTEDPGSLSGKLQWLHKRHGVGFRNYIFTSHKHLLAASNTVLIDDKESNVLYFQEAGGVGILYPRPWNSAWKDPANRRDPVNYVMNQLRVDLLGFSPEAP